MMNRFALILLLSFALTSQAQVPFVKKLDIPSTYQSFFDLCEGRDSSIYILGAIEQIGQPNPPPERIAVVKTDKQGNTLWIHNYRDPNLQIGQAYEYRRIAPTQDSGAVLLGHKVNSTFIVTRIDQQGAVLWSRDFVTDSVTGGTSLEANIIQAANGDILFTGIGNNTNIGGRFLVRLDGNGNMLWSKAYSTDLGRGDLLELPNGDLLVAGQTNDEPTLMQTDAAGNIIWRRYYINSTNNARFGARAIDYDVARQTIIAVSAHGTYVPLFRLTSTGYILWTRFLKDPSGTYEYWPNHVEVAPDHGYFVSGQVRSAATGVHKTFLLKTDSMGAYQWAVKLNDRQPGYGTYSEIGRVRETYNHEVISAGIDSSYFYPSGGEGYSILLTRFDPYGLWPCEAETLSLVDAFYIANIPANLSTIQMPVMDGAAPITDVAFGEYDFIPACTTSPSGITNPETANRTAIYPNPANYSFTLDADSDGTATVFDTRGRRILEQPVNRGKNEFRCEQLLSGMYFVVVRDDKGAVTSYQKLIRQ